MKVLWFANTPCGATEYLLKKNVTSGGWLYSLSTELSKHPEVELHVAFYWGSNTDSFMHKGIYYHPIYLKHSGTKCGRTLNRFKLLFGVDGSSDIIQKLSGVVRNVQPDLIHVHGTEENFGLIAEIINDVPFVVSIQGLLSPYYEKLYSGLSKHQLMQSDRLFDFLTCHNTVQEQKMFYKRVCVEKRILKLIPNIIGRTYWDEKCTLSINPERKYFYVGEILRDVFYKRKWHYDNSHQVFRIVSTTSPRIYKGLETIYKACMVLDKAGIEYEWMIIGVSESDHLAKATTRIVGYQPKDNVSLVGLKSADDIAAILCGSDCYVQVSHIENSPNSLCEAMVLGMPIIASNVGGTASLLTDNEDGLLVQDGDPYILAGTIIEMKNNMDKYIKMGNNAREKALSRHNPDKIVSDLLMTYSYIQQE